MKAGGVTALLATPPTAPDPGRGRQRCRRRRGRNLRKRAAVARARARPGSFAAGPADLPPPAPRAPSVWPDAAAAAARALGEHGDGGRLPAQEPHQDQASAHRRVRRRPPLSRGCVAAGARPLRSGPGAPRCRRSGLLGWAAAAARDVAGAGRAGCGGHLFPGPHCHLRPAFRIAADVSLRG